MFLLLLSRSSSPISSHSLSLFLIFSVCSGSISVVTQTGLVLLSSHWSAPPASDHSLSVPPSKPQVQFGFPSSVCLGLEHKSAHTFGKFILFLSSVRLFFFPLSSCLPNCLLRKSSGRFCCSPFLITSERRLAFFTVFLIWFFSLFAVPYLWTQDQPVCLWQIGMSIINVFTPNVFPYIQMKTFKCLLKFNNQAKLNTINTNLLTSLPYRFVSQTFHSCFSLVQYCHAALKWIWSVEMSIVPRSMSYLALAESF